jgi:hypothetical protein
MMAVKLYKSGPLAAASKAGQFTEAPLFGGEEPFIEEERWLDGEVLFIEGERWLDEEQW